MRSKTLEVLIAQALGSRLEVIILAETQELQIHSLLDLHKSLLDLRTFVAQGG